MELEQTLLHSVIGILQRARTQAYDAVSLAMVEAYWSVGQKIVEEEQKGSNRAEYGAFLLRQLSIRLAGELGKGFSEANLRNFRQFYLTFPEGRRQYAPTRILSWSHYRLLMRLDDIAMRNWYLSESVSQQWTSRALERNIQTQFYERLLSSSDKGNILLSQPTSPPTPRDILKDPYVFEFLRLPEPFLGHESVLETQLLQHLQLFLLELGKGFTFYARQLRISTETQHFYIDLVFYNYLLKCFVLFDLKTHKLTHQDVGQMDMYVRLFDGLQKPPGDNPTLGIILCTDKDETMVKYSILQDNQQLFASRYKTYLPTDDQWIQACQPSNHGNLERSVP